MHEGTKGPICLASVFLSVFSSTSTHHPQHVPSSLDSPSTFIPNSLLFLPKLVFLGNYYSFSMFSSNVIGSLKTLWFPWGKMNNTLLWILKKWFLYTTWTLLHLYQLTSLCLSLSWSVVSSLIACPLLFSVPNSCNIHKLWNYWITE